MTQIIPILSDKCYICLENTMEHSPCGCSYLHEDPCLKQLIENYIKKNNTIKIKCTICKKFYPKKSIKKFLKKIRFRTFIKFYIYDPHIRNFKLVKSIIGLFLTVILLGGIYSGGILINSSINSMNNTTITDYNKFGPHNFLYGFGVFVVFVIFINCFKKCYFGDNALCL